MTEKDMHDLLQEIASTLEMLPGDDLNDIPAVLNQVLYLSKQAYAKLHIAFGVYK